MRLLNAALSVVAGQNKQIGLCTSRRTHKAHTHPLRWDVTLQGRGQSVCIQMLCVYINMRRFSTMRFIYQCTRCALISLCILEELWRQREIALVASPTPSIVHPLDSSGFTSAKNKTLPSLMVQCTMKHRHSATLMITILKHYLPMPGRAICWW